MLYFANIQRLNKNTTKIIESKKNEKSFEMPAPKTTVSKSNKTVRIKIKSDKEIL